MKKLFAILTIFAILLCFAGCGDKPTTPKEKDFSLGTVVDGVYENSFIGIGANLSGDWVYYTQEEINALNGFAGELIGEELYEYIKNADLVYDMYATHNTTGGTVSVNIEKLKPAGVALSEDMELFVSNQMPTTQQALENLGFTNVSYEICDVKLGDNTYKGANIIGEFSGLNLYETIVCIKCDGGYMATLVVGSFGTDTTQDTLGKSYTVE